MDSGGDDPTIYWTLAGFAVLAEVGAVALGYWAGTVNANAGAPWPWMAAGIAVAAGATHTAVVADRIKRRTKKPAP